MIKIYSIVVFRYLKLLLLQFIPKNDIETILLFSNTR